jgi:hypothetical protein
MFNGGNNAVWLWGARAAFAGHLPAGWDVAATGGRAQGDRRE